MHDIVKRLRKYADEYAPVPVEDLRAAADEIERLTSEIGRLIREYWGPNDSKPTPPTSFDELEARVAMLESSARRTGHRIDAAAAAMKDVASRESIHPSVRYVADNLRIAFVGAPVDEEEVDGHG